MPIVKQIRRRGLLLTKVRARGHWVRFAPCGFLLSALFLIVTFHPLGRQVNLGVSSWRWWLGAFSSSSDSKSGTNSSWFNLLVKDSSNYTSTLTSLLLANSTGSSTCYAATTSSAKLEGHPDSIGGRVFFETDVLHYLTLVAYDENGRRRCAGGDYYEVDLHDRDSVRYRSRLPTTDFGNGSYGVDLLVPSRFAGSFTLEIVLLFGNWHGLDIDPTPWAKKTLVLTQNLELGASAGGGSDDDGLRIQTSSNSKSPFRIQQCTPSDFDLRVTWQGRWTRSWFSNDCAPDGQARFQCLPEEHYWCEEPWCFGPVGRLESNGWQYSAHCSFKIFKREEAWKCLDGRWFLMWGDSNFQDTIRNLLLFILDWDLSSTGDSLASFVLARTYERTFRNSQDGNQLFRVSSLFNGAKTQFEDFEGLNALSHKEYQEHLLSRFTDTEWPDTVIMNSGLHDGPAHSSMEAYAKAADHMIAFWTKIYSSLPADRKPQLLWRATVAPAGVARDMSSNPNKMEMFNQVMVEKLEQVHDVLPVKFVDAFDLTFPFHYNNDFSDGGHYGRAPGSHLPPWFGKPHWYFVDIMLAHILLNALCPSS